MLVLLLTLACATLSQESPATSKVQEGTVMTQVDLSVKHIEEASLRHHGANAARQDRLAVEQNNLVAHQIINDNNEEAPNGASFYKFILAPGEKLKVQMGGNPGGRIFMRFVPPPVNDGMAPQFRLANLPPKPVRTKSIAIRNVLKVPTDVVLALYGPVNVPFELKLDRES